MTLKNILLAAALVALPAAPAAAADPRIRTRLYSPDDVVVVEGRAGVQATIAFAEQEQIENVAIGDSASWQVTPNKRADLLFVKPLGPTSRTNMTVVTDRRTYLFDLVASPATPPVYVLRFTYPPEAAKPAKQLAAAMSAEEAQAAAAPPKDTAAVGPPRLNYAWRVNGVRKILPERVYDDGEATYLVWPPKAAIPAILTRNEKGEEGAVNYAVRGEVLVLESVPRVIVLRSGKDSAILENDSQPVAERAKAQAGKKTLPGPTALAAVEARSEGN